MPTTDHSMAQKLMILTELPLATSVFIFLSLPMARKSIDEASVLLLAILLSSNQNQISPSTIKRTGRDVPATSRTEEEDGIEADDLLRLPTPLVDTPEAQHLKNYQV